jgi:hypothetical protein
LGDLLADPQAEDEFERIPRRTAAERLQALLALRVRQIEERALERLRTTRPETESLEFAAPAEQRRGRVPLMAGR